MTVKKLLEKTKKLEQQVRIPIRSKYQILKTIPEIEDIKLKEIVSINKVEEVEEFITKFKVIMRNDYRYPNKDYGLEAELPIGIITTSGLQAGDYVEFLEGDLEGRSLEVIEVINSSTLRLDDVPVYNSIEEDIKIRFIFN